VLPLRYGRVWLSLGLAALLLGVLVAMRPVGGALLFTLGDKVAHAAAFATFAVWFGGLVESRLMWRVALALLAYGVLIEVLQSLVPYRSADSQDLAADAVGILLGWLVSAAGLSHWGRQLEQWLAAPRRP
jgi:VanZ family protein